MKNKLAQPALGRLAGVTGHYIYLMERGMKTPSKALQLLLDSVEEKLKKKRKVVKFMDISNIPFDEIAPTYSKLLKEGRHEEAESIMNQIDDAQDFVIQVKKEIKEIVRKKKEVKERG